MNLTTIDELPDEILLMIFHYLSLDTILILESVSIKWRKLSKDSLVWKYLPVMYIGLDHKKHVFDLFFDDHASLLRFVKIHYVDDHNLLQTMLNNCPNITRLELVMSILKEDILDKLSNWPNLTHIHLKNCLCQTEKLIKFDQFPVLSSVLLSDFGLSNENFHTFFQCNQLVHIQIDKVKGISIDKIQELLKLKRDTLLTLKIYGGECLSDSTIELISKCKKLTTLAIVRCDTLTDRGLLYLCDLKNLRFIQLWNNLNISENCLLYFFDRPWFYNIKMISLSRVGAVSSSLSTLIASKYTSIEFVSFYQCNIKDEDYQLLSEKFPKAKFLH